MKTLKLRPHHIFCTLSYNGKGYSEDFIHNMDKITEELRTNKKTHITMINDGDDICFYCPEKDEKGICPENDKIEKYDKKIMKYLDIKEGEYIYDEIIDRMYNIKKRDVENICGDCMWYEKCNCGEIIEKKVNRYMDEK